MNITKHKVATLTYVLKDNDGTIIDQADEQQPFAYIQGTDGIIPGLESALEGKSAGDNLKVSIDPEQGYGARNDSLVQVVPLDMFQGVDKVETGMQFHAETNQGVNVVTVTKVDGDQVSIDGNHPLAGVTLNFDVTVLEVRDATAEELDHGHAHGPGGHHH